MPESASLIDGDCTRLVSTLAQERGRLYVLCLRWLGGNRADAEDVLGELALRALADRAAPTGAVSSPMAWLTRLAWNLCMDVHRERGNRRRRLDRLAVEVWMHAPPPADPESDRLRRELGDHLDRAVASLPPRLREPSRRRFVEELPYELIAADLGLTNEAVRKRIQEARAALRAYLEAYQRGERGRSRT